MIAGVIFGRFFAGMEELELSYGFIQNRSYE
jgi:hypothetical protein